MSMPVKIIKLTSGQEIIAKVVDVSESVVMIETPYTVQPTRQNDSVGIALLPFLFGATTLGSISLNSHNIVCIVEPDSGLETHYRSIISGIALPETPSPKLTLVG